jgi:hypothetical protein
MGYDEGKIYKLSCEDGHYYYGSTIAALWSRLQGHKLASKKQPYRVYAHINTIGWDKVVIELIENYPCSDKNELNKKESEYIHNSRNDPLCLNTILSCATKEQKREKRKEYVKEHPRVITEDRREYQKGYLKEWREAHKEEIKKKKQEDYLKNKEARDQKNRERYYQNKEEILRKLKEKRSLKTTSV